MKKPRLTYIIVVLLKLLEESVNNGEGRRQMDFNGYSSQVLSWIEGVQKSRGIDTDTTLQLCENIKKYAKERVDEQLLEIGRAHV